MKALSQDLRERIVTAYENKQGTQLQIANRFEVSPETVRNLLLLKRETGSLEPRYDKVPGPPRKITNEKQTALVNLMKETPDLTLAQIKEKLELDCTVQAIHYALNKLGYSFKKRHCEPQNKTEKT